MKSSRKVDLILGKLTYLECRLTHIQEALTAMTAQFDNLKAQVERCTSVSASAVTLLQGLHDQIVALKDDPAALQAMADQLKADTDGLVAAVSANTPAVPVAPPVAPPVVPPPVPGP